MSIATRITSITNHIEKDYQALESVVGKVSVNKNIENIAPLLDNLWEDLPKTTGSGTSPSISDTRAGKMKLTLKGNTSQTGTPTPDNPISVNVVSGDNEVVVTGKNLFDKDNANILNGYIDTSTIVSNGNYKSYYIECKPNTTYTISRTGTSSLYACTSQTTPTLSGSISNKTNGNTSSVTITTDGNANYLIVQAYRSSYDDATIVLDTLMINEGSTALPYEPYQSSTYPIHLGTYELCKIGTYQDKFIRNSGKNLLNLSTITTGYGDVSKTIDISSLELTATGTSGSQYVQQTIGQLDSTKSYTFKCNAKKIVKGTDGYPRIMIKLFGSNDNSTYTEIETIQEANPTQGQEYVLTKTLTGYSYYKLYYYNNAYTPVTIGEKTLYYNLMLNEGETALPYEPYGNGEWYLEKHIGKVVLDENTNFNSVDNLGSDTYRFTNNSLLDGINSIPYTYGLEVGYSNYFHYLMQYSGSLSDQRVYTDNRGLVIITSVASTTNELSTWLGNNNTTVYYQMTIPTYTKIEGTLKDELEDVWRAYSYKGQTNISQINNDLPFELSITALEG